MTIDQRLDFGDAKLVLVERPDGRIGLLAEEKEQVVAFDLTYEEVVRMCVLMRRFVDSVKEGRKDVPFTEQSLF